MPYREELYRIANHIASSKGALPDEWQSWADEIESNLRELASWKRDKQKPVGIVRYFDVGGPKHPKGIHISLYERLPEGIELYAAPVVPDDIVPRLPEILRTGKGNRWEIQALANACSTIPKAATREK